VLLAMHGSTAVGQSKSPRPSSGRNIYSCPNLVKIVEGIPIRPGAFATPKKYNRGIKVVTPEMAMTKLEFETAAGFKMRVPASALNISTRRCDDEGRFESIRFDLYWVGGKLSASAELPELPDPEGFKYGLKQVRTHGYFRAGPYRETLPQEKLSYIERERKWYGPPTPLPQFGLTAYARLRPTEPPEKSWDVFVLNTVRDYTGVDIVYQCTVKQKELLSGQFDPKLGFCRTSVAFREGFGGSVAFGAEFLPDAGEITRQLIQKINSYVASQ